MILSNKYCLATVNQRESTGYEQGIMCIAINYTGVRCSFANAHGGHSLHALVQMAVIRKNCLIFGLKGDSKQQVLPCHGEPTGVYRLGTRKNVVSINYAGARCSFAIADGGHSLHALVKMPVTRKNCSIFGLKGDTEQQVLPCHGEPTGVYRLGPRKNVRIDKLCGGAL